jgi:hypothetical protein
MRRYVARAAAFFRDRYGTVDVRSLALFRIVFGLHLIVNLYDRTQGPDGVAFYTNDGLYPNHYAIFNPLGDKIWSLLFPFSTPGEVQVALFAMLAVYLFYVVGYHTKVAQVLAVACFLSLDNRNLILQNGGIVVTNLVAIWSAFLPLGARFSIDHLLRSLRERREASPVELADRAAMRRGPERYARVAFFGLLINFACIYFFNYAHKRGITWRDGLAVHWVLWQNRIATIWAALIRAHEPRWFSPAATYGTLVLEASLPPLLLLPIYQRWTRRIAIAAIWALHGGIALMMTLGPFSYSMMSFSLLLLGARDWDIAKRAWRSHAPRVTVFYDPSSGWHHRLARVLARLDGRERLAFVDIREARISLPAIPDGVFAVAKKDESRFDVGALGLARAISALPCGFAWAWPLRIAIVRRRIEPIVTTAHGPDEDDEPWVDAPASQWARGAKVACGQALASVLLATIVLQIGSDNWAIPDKYRIKKRPEFMREVVEYLRLPQGWSMFSPDAPKDDGTIVIDAVLSDGRHIDPRKQRPPDFDAAFHGPWYYDQQWCDWDLRMRWDSSRHLYPYFRDYIARLDRMASWKEHATIRSFDVYWVNNGAPPPGTTRPYDITRQLLFRGEPASVSGLDSLAK